MEWSYCTLFAVFLFLYHVWCDQIFVLVTDPSNFMCHGTIFTLFIQENTLTSWGNSPNKNVCTIFILPQHWYHTGPWFNIKMSSYQYRKSHCGDKTVVRSSYLHNGISYTGKMSSLYWIGVQVAEILPYIRTRIYPFYIVNIMGVDDLMHQGQGISNHYIDYVEPE